MIPISFLPRALAAVFVTAVLFWAWLRARLAEPSTYGGLAGLCIMGGVWSFTFWGDWRLMIYAAGILFIVQAIKAEQGVK